MDSNRSEVTNEKFPDVIVALTYDMLLPVNAPNGPDTYHVVFPQSMIPFGYCPLRNDPAGKASKVTVVVEFVAAVVNVASAVMPRLPYVSRLRIW